jgi:glucose-6-phosphate 1-epimerase
MASTTELASLNERFAIPGTAEIVAGGGGLPKIRVTAPRATAEIYLHGAQLTSWKPAGHEDVIFLSKQARFEAGRAIRGGVPICFPWFRDRAGDPSAPQHGFVRTRAWQLTSVASSAEGVTVILTTFNDPDTRKWWPHDFTLSHRITVGAELRLELTMTNTGTTPLRFEEALHSYHLVGDVRQCAIHGLDGVHFKDNTDGKKVKMQAGDIVMTGPTDNAYLETTSVLIVRDPVFHRSIRIVKGESRSTVVWNPWDAGAASLADLGDEEWRGMVCVEAANIQEDAVTLLPGAGHTMSVTISVTQD